MRSHDNFELLNRLHATVNQTGGPIIFPKDSESGEYITDMSEFKRMLQQSRKRVEKFHREGMYVIAYTTMALGGSSETFEDIPKPEELNLNDAYQAPGLWNAYQEYFGPRPPEGPDKWPRYTHDGKYSYYRFRHPNAPRTGGRFEMFGCQDNPSYVQYMEGVLKLIAAGGFDGAYIDWTKVHGGTCYCPHSKEAFRTYLRENVSSQYLKKRYGITDITTIEPPVDNTMVLWREWLQFRSWSLTEFQRQVRAAARTVNPDFRISGNINGGAYGNMAYTNGDDMEMMGTVMDFFYSEIQHGLQSVPRTEMGTKISNSGPLKFLAASAMQKPVWMYCIQPSTPKPIPNEDALFNLIKLNIGEAFANHNTFSVVRETFGEPISPRVHSGAEQIYAFFEKNEENLIGAKLAANVAVFCSIDQFYSDEFSYFNPASRMLADNGIAHVMTVERDFSREELAKYDVLVLPYVPLMSDREVKIIENYVRNGGGLVVLGLSSFKDEYGLRRENLGLAGLLGFDLQNTPVEITRSDVGEGRVVFVPFNPLPVGKGGTGDTPLPDDHMMYGQGKFPDRIKPAFEAIPAAVEWTAQGNLSGKMSAPSTVEFTTMDQPGKNLQLVHLVNYNVNLDGEVTPAEDVKVSLRVPEGKKVKRVTAGSPLSDTAEISFRFGDPFIEIDIPSFEVYSLVTVYYE
ncbi:MAG: beta-galactosidase [Candidatus Marinimicrobia bacterium]|nr:beta-galactosidase [Candidatus Neomarinimicrobiota bacterium]MCF7830200.1 beta-galactosidase [Candidatus Neomarinimicrobiota bacterium]MCF7880817.1 beta-galactosidase [Candidatus Neomarinimicrobiota bacterium]